MPSPFPGMDPHLERPPMWPNVHHGLISEMRAALNRSLGKRYVACVEERVYLADEDDESPVRVPDVRITKTPKRGGSNGVALDEAPARAPLTVHIMTDDEVHEARIEIRDTEGKSVVTVIEVLSPANKRPGSNGHASFKKKRDDVLHSKTHWVEIDLLRFGRPATAKPRRAQCEYQVVVSPVKLRPKGLFWPILLREPLPTIAIPLRKGDADVALDLQAILTSAYERGAYERTIEYDGEPHAPLAEPDAKWANALLRKKGMRK